MRLIDADKLKNKLQARHDNGNEDFDKGYNIGLGTAIDLIDNAPTVEMPKALGTVDKNGDIKLELIKPQGKWNYIQSGMCVCPLCGAMPHKLYKNFCANCGADMRGGAE